MSIDQRLIPFNPSNLINIFTSSKLDNDFLRPITFQPITTLSVWRDNFQVKLNENFVGSFLQIIVTNIVCNTTNF